MHQKELAGLSKNENLYLLECTIVPLTEIPIFIFPSPINPNEIRAHLPAVTYALDDTLCRKKSIPTEHRFHHLR